MEDPHTQHGVQTLEGTYITTQPSTVLPYHIRNCLSLTEQLYQLKNENKFCDLLFEIHNQTIRAHRAVVASWSPYIVTQLKSNATCSEIVRVNYDNFEIFSDMIAFMYTGKIDLRDTNLIQLLHLATSFQIEALREVCEGTLRCNLHVGNIVSTFYVARKFKLCGLEEYALAYLQMHLPEAVKQLDFLNLAAVQFNTFLATGWVIHLKPEVKLFLIISWLGYDVKDREQYLIALLQHIDWSTVAGDFLQEISQTENFFTTNESSLFLLLQTLHSSGISLGSYVDVFPSLRGKYSYLLHQVVQNCVLDVSPEEYYPVCITVTVDTTQETLEVSQTQSSPKQTEVNSVESLIIETEEVQEGIKIQKVVTEAPQPLIKKKNNTRGKKKTVTTSHEQPPNRRMNTRNKAALQSKKTQELPEPTVHFEESSKEAEPVGTHSHGEEEEDEDEEDFYHYDNNSDDDDTNDPDFVQPEKVDEETDAMFREVMKSVIKKTGSSSKCKNKMRKCNDCDYTTSSESRLEDHQRKQHTGDTDKTFECHICDQTFSWNKKFYTHMKEHYYGPPFTCKHGGCNYTADTIRNILIHRVRHTDERPFPCEQCPLRFRTRSNLYAHKKCHIGKKPWKCDVCGQSFATKSTLGQHSVRHSEDRPYLCDLCGFGTKFQSHLISHKRLHTGEVYRCKFPQCSYFSPKKSTLKGHMRTHFGVRKYNCGSCSKSFVEKSHLVRHEKIHLEIRPFGCSECNYSTHRKDKLKEHVQKRHGNTDPPTDKTKKVKKKKKKDVKVEQGEPVTSPGNVQLATDQHSEPDPRLYPQIVHNAQYINALEPVVLDTTGQNMVMHNNQGLVSEGHGQLMTTSIGHQQLHPVATPIEHQQLTVVMDTRVHAHLNTQGLIIDPLTQSGSIQTLGPSNGGDGNIVYAVPTTTAQAVVMATPQQEYSNLGSYYSFVVNHDGQ